MARVVVLASNYLTMHGVGGLNKKINQLESANKLDARSRELLGALKKVRGG